MDEKSRECGQVAPLSSISARELQALELPPVRFIVDGFLPSGLSILAAPPKAGKSWFVLDLCLSVAMGRPFLGMKVNRCACLYIALEDSLNRLKGRESRVLNGEPAPDNCYFATAAPTLDDGALLDALEAFIAAHRGVGLAVIDTFQKIRGAPRGRETLYGGDYREAGALKAFADRHNIAVLLVHHFRKQGDDADVFNMVSGSSGLTGAADMMATLSQDKRGAETSTLTVTGRDVPMSETVVAFDKTLHRWVNRGDVVAYAEEVKRRNYINGPLRATILKLLEQRPAGWTGSSKALLEAGEHFTGERLAVTSQELAKKLADMTELFLEADGIIYEARGNGNGGRRHSFSYRRAFEELDGDEESPFLID